ncbi:MAG TPA: GntR family transcriptional regulator [Galbitalea sp.]
MADKVYEILLEQFMDGTRGAGEPLNIATLSRELDVSQTPIREALARLEHTGLVRREALKGYSVAPLFTENDLLSLRAARVVLEPAMAVEAGRNVTAAFLNTLLETIEVLDAVSGSNTDTRTFPRFWSADEKFHTAIAAQSGNQFLAMAYSALGGQVQRFRLFAELGTSDARFAAIEHRRIYDAFVRNDPVDAAEQMRRHVSDAGTRALKDLGALEHPGVHEIVH